MNSLSDYFKNNLVTKKVRVPKSRFKNDSGLMACMPEDVFERFITTSSSYLEIDENILREIEEKYNKRKASNRHLNDIVVLNNKGIEFEKNGNIKKAIEQYEKCINLIMDKFDVFHQIAWHSPDRLRILYKKEKKPERT